jgi:pyruvate dehydrogenase E1 component alpha subunit/2-oxoisovalerate dehydrogenase E1 component alpha subunit
MRRHLESRGLAGDRDQRLVAEIAGDIERAVAEARNSEKPARETMFQHVYAAPPWHLVEQKDGR